MRQLVMLVGREGRWRQLRRRPAALLARCVFPEGLQDGLVPGPPTRSLQVLSHIIPDFCEMFQKCCTIVNFIDCKVVFILIQQTTRRVRRGRPPTELNGKS